MLSNLVWWVHFQPCTYYFPGLLMKLYSMGGHESLSRLSLPVYKCGDGWGYCWYTSKTWSSLIFFPLYIHFLGHLSLINLPSFSGLIFSQYRFINTDILALSVVRSDHNNCGWFFGCDWLFTLRNALQAFGTVSELAVWYWLPLLKQAKNYIAVFLQPKHRCILQKKKLVYDIAWLALTLIVQVIFRIMITKNGCICRHFEVWRRKWALPIDMAKEDIWVGLGKEVGTDQTWVSVIKQR